MSLTNPRQAKLEFTLKGNFLTKLKLCKCVIVVSSKQIHHSIFLIPLLPTICKNTCQICIEAACLQYCDDQGENRSLNVNVQCVQAIVR